MYVCTLIHGIGMIVVSVFIARAHTRLLRFSWSCTRGTHGQAYGCEDEGLVLLLQAPTAAIGCEAGALQEDTEPPSRETAAHKATSVDSSPDVSLAPEVAWAKERLSEDNASRRSVHSAGVLQSQAAIGKSGGVQGRVERADTSLAVEDLSSDRSQPTP